jgi:hypothetical protein
VKVPEPYIIRIFHVLLLVQLFTQYLRNTDYKLCYSVCMSEGVIPVLIQYRGADKSLARPGTKQATATEDFDVHIAYL